MTLPPPLKKLHRMSVWQLVLGIVGLAGYLLEILLILALSSNGGSGISGSNADVQLMQKYPWMLAFFACLTIPSIYFSKRRLNGVESAPVVIKRKMIVFLLGIMLLWGGLIYLGNRMILNGLPIYLTTFLNIAVIGLPVLFWVTLGSFQLRIHSKQRAWGVFTFSQLLTSSIVTFTEVILVLVVLVFAGIWFSQQAEFLPYLNILQNQGALTEENIQSILSEILPLLDTPTLLIGIFLGVCLAIPMIEELLKPLAVWLFVGKEITPSEGFALGLICGGGFALVESLAMMSMADSSLWLSTAIGRAGTSLLHVTTVGLSGWALAKSWQDGKYWRISFCYLGVILLHGIWNFFALLMGVNRIAVPIESVFVRNLMPLSSWVLGILGLILAVILLLFNRRLHKGTVPPALSGTMNEPAEKTIIY